MIYISLICIALAAVCNAIMDIIVHHYHKSIFTNKKYFKGYWWNGSSSWKNKYIDGDITKGRRKIKGTNINYPVQLTDAWHFFKMWMIVFICASIVTFPGGLPIYKLAILFLTYGALWNNTFSLFYNKILIK